MSGPPVTHSILDHASFVGEQRQRAIAQSNPAHGILVSGRIDSREPRRFLLRYTNSPPSVLQELARDIEVNAFTARAWKPPGEADSIYVIYSPASITGALGSNFAVECSVELEELLATD